MTKRIPERRERRIDLNRAAVLLNSDAVESEVLILDVSKGGFRVRTAEILRVGELVKLRVEHNEEYPAQIRWVVGAEAGAAFLAPISHLKVA